jgi:hypothetical protein
MKNVWSWGCRFRSPNPVFRSFMARHVPIVHLYWCLMGCTNYSYVWCEILRIKNYKVPLTLIFILGLFISLMWYIEKKKMIRCHWH